VIDELIARLEAATVGSRELDAEIWLSIMKNGESMLMALRESPHYTASLDAALTLVPEGWAWELDWDKDGDATPAWSTWSASAFCHPADRDPQNPHCPRGMSRKAKTPALALCIAALRAREKRDE